MKHLRFRISYKTQWGERIAVEMKVGENNPRLFVLNTTDGCVWTGEFDADIAEDTIYYNYCVCREDETVVRREPSVRRLPLSYRTKVFLSDCWDDGSIHPVMHRSAFTECVFKPKADFASLSSYTLTLHALPAPEGKHWAVCGSSAGLGEWQPSAAQRLQRTGVYEWSVGLSSADFIEGLDYKYLLVSDSDASDIEWEEGENRRLMPFSLRSDEVAVHSDVAVRMPLPLWRGAGVVIPVFSLRSEGSHGVGDFGDLRIFIDWAASVGMRAVQLLPINDTTTTGTWHDSYPYSGISVYALHPIYLDMREWKRTSAYLSRCERGKELNALPTLDYEAVLHEKMAFLRELFAKNGSTVLKSPAFKDFCRENNHWLTAYCRFCRLRDENATANFRDWRQTGVDSAAPQNKKEEREELFYAFVQFLLHRQMQAAHEEAREKGVILKGDIPIGICRDSVPAWAETHLFRFNGQAGAPPDAFARHGQNWGFPTYHWEEMSKDGYAWWRNRFKHMSHYFDAYRIDHVLGFFRIWEIPYKHIYGLLGRFRPALPLSKEEIAAFGFTADAEAYARPLLTEERLRNLSSQPGGDALRGYVEPYPEAEGTQHYALKPEYDTQRKVMDRVSDELLRQLLLDIHAEVLFIEDDEQPGRYHPRIAAQETWRFAALDEANRQAFNRLHDDFFYVRHNQFWADEAMKKLPQVTGVDASTSALLPCAEDLGMVPSSVKGVLEQLSILSLEIQRMPKRYGVRFDDLNLNPWLSVSTIATHDMPPLRLWWHENEEQTQAFWQEALHRNGTAPADATPEVCEQIVAQHMESPSMLCLLALQDWLSIDGNLRRRDDAAEQINDPANPAHNWNYRMHLTIEQLNASGGWNEKLRGLIRRSGRV